jgi:hypothetical protein
VAHLLHRILTISAMGRLDMTELLKQLSFSSGTTNTTNSNMPNGFESEQFKQAYPLPLHMPQQVVVSVFSPKKQGYIQVHSTEWNGQLTPPISKAAQRIWDQVYPNHEDSCLGKEDDELGVYTRAVGSIKSVKGPAGWVGLRAREIW